MVPCICQVPILLSDAVSPEIILVGTAVPLIVYYAIKRLVIDPYIERADSLKKKDARKRNRRVIEQRRREVRTLLAPRVHAHAKVPQLDKLLCLPLTFCAKIHSAVARCTTLTPFTAAMPLPELASLLGSR